MIELRISVDYLGLPKSLIEGILTRKLFIQYSSFSIHSYLMIYNGSETTILTSYCSRGLGST